MRPTRGYYANLEVSAGPISRFFNGDSTSAIGLRPSLGSDLWAAIQPDIDPLQRLMSDADKRFLMASPNVQALVVAGLVAHYEDKPPPAVFRVIVAPLVEWIWLGGIVAIAGGLIAIWPNGLAALLFGLPARLRPHLRRLRPATS
jgi:cytochrome c-type biogenesis protein CcmF